MARARIAPIAADAKAPGACQHQSLGDAVHDDPRSEERRCSTQPSAVAHGERGAVEQSAASAQEPTRRVGYGSAQSNAPRRWGARGRLPPWTSSIPCAGAGP